MVSAGEIGALVIKAGVVLFLALNVVPIMVYAERKVSAFIQKRIGPEKIGVYGIVQPLADALKFILKEAFLPPDANKFFYYAGPVVSTLAPMLAFMSIPLIPILQPVRTELSALVVIAFSSLGVWGLLLGGWASENKFSLLGALRASSQFISYEVSLSASILAMLILYGTFDFAKIVDAQGTNLLKWGVFLNPLAFLTFFISALAESGRIPFDLPEAEAELVGGYHTEYSGMKFAMFFMGEFVHLALTSCVMILLFFGGWNIPFINISSILPENYLFTPVFEYLIGFIVFSVKLLLLLGTFILIRWTWPRFRFDQLIRFSWGTLIPLSLISIAISTLIAVL